MDIKVCFSSVNYRQTLAAPCSYLSMLQIDVVVCYFWGNENPSQAVFTTSTVLSIFRCCCSCFVINLFTLIGVSVHSRQVIQRTKQSSGNWMVFVENCYLNGATCRSLNSESSGLAILHKSNSFSAVNICTIS